MRFVFVAESWTAWHWWKNVNRVTAFATVIAAAAAFVAAWVARRVGREAAKIAVEQNKIAVEQNNIAREQTRAANEQARAADEQSRTANEQARVADNQQEIAGLQALTLAYDRFFSSPEIKGCRLAFSSAWLGGQRDDRAAKEILNTLETVGLHVRRGYVPPEVVSDLMSFWVIAYWYGSRSYVDERRAELKDPTVWVLVERLVDALQKVSNDQGVKEWASTPSHDDLERVFGAEVQSLSPVQDG